MPKHPKVARPEAGCDNKAPRTHIFQKPKLEYAISIRDFPWSDKQKDFLKLACDKETRVMLVKGPAGTAKSLLAVNASLKSLNEKKIGDIVYIRNPVESSSFSLGFLKGGLEEKLSPYLQPMMDKLNESLSKSEIDKLLKEERIRGMPLNFLRGLTFNVCNVIVDEAQNLKIEDLLLIMTRMGKFSKLFLCGDIMQSDIRNDSFEKIFRLFGDEESRNKGIHTFEFGSMDIFRSDILAFIIEKFTSIQK